MLTWQTDDVRGLAVVSDVHSRAVERTCGFCGQPFVAAWWVALSVAREGRGGTTISLCEPCALASWDELVARVELVAEVLEASDTLRR